MLVNVSGPFFTLSTASQKCICNYMFCCLQLEEERCGKLVLERDMKQLQARVASLQAARNAQTTTLSSHKQQAITNVSVMPSP